MKKIIVPILCVALALSLSGCNFIATMLPTSPSIKMTIDEVRADSLPGQYVLYGQTSLPIGTEFVISAIRPLTSANPGITLSENTIHGILARNTAISDNGYWQAQLNLWQASPEGTYQESWQQQDPLAAMQLTPSPDVEFLMTLSPQQFAQKKQSDFEALQRLGKHPLFKVTPAGEPYLEAQRTMAVPFPNSQMTVTAPPAAAAKTSLWEGRSAHNGTVVFSPEEQLPFTKNDNLPITASNMLQ